MTEYWTIAAEEALDEAGLDATTEQIKAVAKAMEAAHDMYGEQHGHHEASRSLWADKEREISDLRRQLCDEEEKVPCPECEGKWAPGLGGTIEPARYTCWKCDGSGKVRAGEGREPR